MCKVDQKIDAAIQLYKVSPSRQTSWSRNIEKKQEQGRSYIYFPFP